MKSQKEKLWLTALLVVGCGSRLQVDPSPPSVGGATGIAGTGVAGTEVAGTEVGGSDIGLVEPPPQGGLEQPCISGGTETEAANSVAQADVTRLERCNDGLMCGPDKRCLVVPDCPQPNGICIVRHADPTSGGAGGDGGNSGLGSSGYGGTSSAGSSATAAVSEPAVVALAADVSRLYWAEYGSRDALGNYQNDGALKASDLSGGAVATVAADLAGPLDVKLTQTQAYVLVDGAPLIGSQRQPQLFRVPLSGGSPTLVPVDMSVYSLIAANDDSAFFSKVNEKPADFFGVSDASIYRWRSTGDASLTPVATNLWYGAAIDATDLFYWGSGTAAWRVPLAGGEPISVGLAGSPFALRGDSIYWIESLDNNVGILLDQLPKAGGAPQRIRGLGAGGSTAFQLAGDRFFSQSGLVGYEPLGVRTASFTSAAPPVQLLDVTAAAGVHLRWVGTPSAFYWTDGNAIYSRSLADLP